MQAEITPELERVLEASLARRRSRLLSRESLIDGAFAVTFVVAAIALIVFGATEHPPLALGFAFAAGYGLVALAEFQAGSGYTMPTQAVFVPMLLLLDPATVPLLIALALVGKAAWQTIRAGQPHERMLVAVADSWFSFVPALVLVLADPGAPAFEHWPLYVGVLAAQFAGDGLISGARAWSILHIHPRQIWRELVEVYRIDALLAPIGLLAAIAAVDDPATALLVCPLAVLLRHFSGERDMRIQQQLELSRAYRGTALLLGDVIEDDDEYTGQHTRGVVLLAGMVADELGLDEEAKRDTEFGALLHDVGKIAIPKDIINKPGPLDDDEWAIMKTHTVEGQRLLERVGGILSRVGVVVRASHERYDGKGYPDGLAREDIPLPARIVSCCDAYNAMTTDRSYRAALPVPVALGELRNNAGTQFDPDVVDAVVSLIERWDPEMTDAEPAPDVDEAIRALLAGEDDGE